MSTSSAALHAAAPRQSDFVPEGSADSPQFGAFASFAAVVSAVTNSPSPFRAGNGAFLRSFLRGHLGAAFAAGPSAAPGRPAPHADEEVEEEDQPPPPVEWVRAARQAERGREEARQAAAARAVQLAEARARTSYADSIFDLRPDELDDLAQMCGGSAAVVHASVVQSQAGMLGLRLAQMFDPAELAGILSRVQPVSVTQRNVVRVDAVVAMIRAGRVRAE